MTKILSFTGIVEYCKPGVTSKKSEFFKLRIALLDDVFAVDGKQTKLSENKVWLTVFEDKKQSISQKLKAPNVKGLFIFVKDAKINSFVAKSGVAQFGLSTSSHMVSLSDTRLSSINKCDAVGDLKNTLNNSSFSIDNRKCSILYGNGYEIPIWQPDNGVQNKEGNAFLSGKISGKTPNGTATLCIIPETLII